MPEITGCMEKGKKSERKEKERKKTPPVEAQRGKGSRDDLPRYTVCLPGSKCEKMKRKNGKTGFNTKTDLLFRFPVRAFEKWDEVRKTAHLQGKRDGQ